MIKWYRKGGILPQGSNAIFGMNGNNLMRGGEVGTGGEAILPLSDLFKEMKWYRKGGILPQGSNAIFGMNGNNLMRGGEVGTGGEAILPLSDLFKEMNGMFDRQNKNLVSSLTKGNNQPINLTLNIDGKTLAKSLPLSDLFKEMNGMFDRQNKNLVSSLTKGNNQPINLTLNIDGKTLAKSQFKSFKELTRRGIIDFADLV